MLRPIITMIIQKEMLPANHLALTHKKYLHCRQTFISGQRHRQHIPIIAAGVHILLALHQLNGGNTVAQLGGLLKTQFIRSAPHLLIQISQHAVAFAFQKLHNLPAHLPINLLIHLAGTKRQTTANMKV